MKKMALGKFPPGEFLPGKFPPHQTPPCKIPTPRKFSSGISPPISLIVFLHLTLRFDKSSQT